jgi:predicted Fe-Mo cluster-binding NifX family protein
MKIAVTSQEKKLTSLIDPRFGRAAYILFVDTDTMKFEFIDNIKNKNAFKDAGIRTANIVCKNDAKVLITYFCGPNAYRTLEEAGIMVADRLNGRVLDGIENFRTGRLVFSNCANAERYW